jgi:hypothetical protein
MDDLKDLFANPGALYRGKPFWAWNGELEAEELRRQIRVMHRMGLGGFFMHSRVGLATAYLSDEWFRMVEACADEASKLGMEAWLYDEDRWPSGAAGGLVTRDPRYRHKSLVMAIFDPSAARVEQEKPLALFSAQLDGIVARNVRRLGPDWDGKVTAQGASVLAFFVRPDRPESWYNDATYLDTMSHEAVSKFIEVTHEAYRQRVGRYFGTVVPGIFTDEPHHGWVFGRGFFDQSRPTLIPWTDRLPEVFRSRYGYDVLDHLPHLFLNVDGEEVSQARLHYHDCKTFLFVDAFARQIFEWCQKNNLLFTGHVLSEPTLRSQAQVGGAPMRFYEYMQAPGIDVLTEHRYEYTTAKQCSSVLHQTGRRWLLSELYGCTGWDWPFEGHKASGDWQAALGVNLRCQHLSWYTMSGQAKRDYPASISFQSPWWEQYAKVEDYFARVDAVVSRGEPLRKLLVVHPIESTWARANVKWLEDKGQQRLEDQFSSLIRWLLDEHVDFDYGDEEMMSRLASVEPGNEPAFRLGQAAYDVVLVPPVDTLRGTTLRLLRDFAAAGGTVVFAGKPPTYLDARKSTEVADFARTCKRVPFRRPSISKAVRKARAVSIRDGSGAEKADTLYLLLREGQVLRLFMCNTDRKNATGPLTVSVRGKGNVQLWDAETGRRWAVAAEQDGEAVRFETAMPPSGSRIYVITPEAESLPAAQELHEVRSLGLQSDNWTAAITDHNVLVLDMPEFRAGQGGWEGPMEVLKADAAIRKAIGLPLRSGSMVQPWARPKVQGPTGPVELRYRFQVDEPQVGPLFLALENPRYFSISLNGRPIPTEADCGWWVDPSIRLLPLDEAALARGENTLLLSGTMDADCNLEACFLLGQFSVRVEGASARICGPLGRVTFGDLRDQGLPFYSGSVVFRTAISAPLEESERLFLVVPEFAGVCVRVLVDGKEAGTIAWPPYEVDITDLAAGRLNTELAVELIGHRRNAFGPMHILPPHPPEVGPYSFTTAGEHWQDAYSTVAVGLTALPRLSVRK